MNLHELVRNTPLLFLPPFPSLLAMAGETRRLYRFELVLLLLHTAATGTNAVNSYAIFPFCCHPRSSQAHPAVPTAEGLYYNGLVSALDYIVTTAPSAADAARVALREAVRLAGTAGDDGGSTCSSRATITFWAKITLVVLDFFGRDSAGALDQLMAIENEVQLPWCRMAVLASLKGYIYESIAGFGLKEFVLLSD